MTSAHIVKAVLVYFQRPGIVIGSSPMLGVTLRRRARMRASLVLCSMLAVASCTGKIGETESSSASGGSSTGGGASATAGGTGGGTSGATTSSGGGGSSIASASVGRRLTRAELDNTVRDLLGDTTAPATKFLIEDEFRPFDNDYTVQTASGALIDSLAAFADAVAARAVAPENRASIVPCTPSGPGDAVCFRQTVEKLGGRLFRRPLDEEEIGPYLALQ